MKKILVAVSGGVDSVVLLDFLVKNIRAEFGMDFLRENLIVAHFEHGIRSDSVADLAFVRGLASKNLLKFEFEHGDLGENTSEEKARSARYDFLRRMAKKHDAEIWTAHHRDDLIETILINIHRGTGWRGLACLDSPDICRIFLRKPKSELLKYAEKNHLVWREDSTNSSDKYLRNRFRKTLKNAEINGEEIYDLWKRQIEIRNEIDKEILQILPKIKFQNGERNEYLRYFFSQIDEKTACEILRKIILDETGKVPLQNQIFDFWLKTKVFSAKKMHFSGGFEIYFSKTHFWFEKASKK